MVAVSTHNKPSLAATEIYAWDSRIRCYMSNAAKGLSSHPLIRLVVIPTVYTPDPAALSGCFFIGCPVTPQTKSFSLTTRVDVVKRATSKALRESQMLSKAHFLPIYLYALQ